jgi:hypothetical protein
MATSEENPCRREVAVHRSGATLARYATSNAPPVIRLPESQDREESAKKTAYLNAMRSGIKLSARSCPDGEGKHYIVGLRPKIKPEVVECIDVGYTESCPGSAASSSGTVSNFIGISTDCFMGDVATVNPTPACNPKMATVKITRVVACGG